MTTLSDIKQQTTGIKDTGDRRTFTSGAQRDRAHGKGTFKLFPAIAYFFISRIFEDGGIKYEERNWEKGMPIEEFIDSAERHIQKYKAGLRDEPHLSMAGWNIVCALWTAAMVHLGLRDAKLFNLPNHTPYDNPGPLSPYEEKALVAFMGEDTRLNKGRVYKDANFHPETGAPVAPSHVDVIEQIRVDNVR